MPGSLSDKLTLRHILVGGNATDQAAAMEAVSKLLESHPAVKDFGLLVEDLKKREQLESTCLGNELALPHARTEAVREMVLAAGAFPEGVVAGEGQKIKLVFVIGTPTGEVTDYLTAVGALARMMKTETVRRKLAHAKSSEEFLHAFREAEAGL